MKGQEPGDAIRTPEIQPPRQPRRDRQGRARPRDRLAARHGRFGDLIVEGRDIDRCFPGLARAFISWPAPRQRAERRRREEIEKGIANQSIEEVKRSLLARDTSSTPHASTPRCARPTALEIDSTCLTLDQVVQTVLDALPDAWKGGWRMTPSSTVHDGALLGFVASFSARF